jgi:hypothetical protein
MIWEHFSDFIHSKIGNLSLKFPFVLLLSDKLPKKKTLLGRYSILPTCTTLSFAVCIVCLKFPTLLLFDVDMHAVTLTSTSS